MAASMREERVALSVTTTDIEQAREFSSRAERALGSQPADAAVSIRVGNGDSVDMPIQLVALVSRVLELVGSGRTVTIGTIPNEVTTTVAAKMLGVSRPTVMKLIADGALPAHKVGSHTRLRSADVLARREDQRAAQRESFDRLRDFEDQLGLDE